MENKKLGAEPAFPNGMEVNNEYGMSKRFYAACAAMNAMIANPNIVRPNPINGFLEDQYKIFIGIAYEYADELLKQEDL